MQLDIGQWIVIVICAVLIAGYAYGYYANRQLAERVVAWLHPGLRRWGKVTAGERLGGMATGGRLLVKNASAPIQDIEAVFLLSPRENMLFWLFDRLRGRQDELILKINLRDAPKKNLWLEAGRRNDRDFRETVEKEKYTLIDPLANGLQIAVVDQDTPMKEPVKKFLERYAHQLMRLSLRKQKPHWVIRARLKPMLQHSMEDLLTDLSAINHQE
ncbi:MAG: hypothetical protein JW908_03095 [Anaerolineales bacterium]|nr:hypothetical protein [Anaerolineales bacterium]